MKSMLRVVVFLFMVLFLLWLPLMARAQAPPSLPGFSISGFVGYTAVQGQQSGNGMFTSFAVPLKTVNKKYSFTIAARLDNFLLLTPATNTILGGPEGRFQFSSATFLDGHVFQPFGNFMVGATRAACVAASNCPAGQSTSSNFSWKIGGGLDIVTSTHTVWRLLEIDRIQLPNGQHVNLNNGNQFLTAFGVRF